MDNLTHTLIGIVLAKAGLRKRFGPGTTRVLAIASNLPDLDVLVFLFKGEQSFLYRRMLTHSLLGTFLLAVLFTFIFKSFFRSISWKASFGLTFLGIVIHIFFDLLNTYGVVLLYPFSLHRFELSWVFIIDLAFWVILLAPFIFSRLTYFKKKSPMLWWRVSVLSLSLYIGLCALSHAMSIKLLRNQTDGKADFVYAFPEAFGVHRFRGVIRFGNEYQLYLVYPFSGKLELMEQIPTVEDGNVKKLSALPIVQKLLWFAKAPVWEKAYEGHYLLYDLRFRSLVLNWRSRMFAFEFDVPQSQDAQ